MRYTYIGAANNTVAAKSDIHGTSVSSAGQPLGTQGEDVRIYKILVGAPVANGNITVFNKAIVTASDTSDIAAKITLPATITYQFTTANGAKVDWDFGPEGLPLDGGNVQIDQSLQLTVVWDFAQ